MHVLYARSVSIGGPEIVVVVVGLALVVAIVTVLRKRLDVVPCRACRAKVSPRAKKCPRCGEPRQILRG
jgi:ribosomal protein L40E